MQGEVEEEKTAKRTEASFGSSALGKTRRFSPPQRVWSCQQAQAINLFSI
jgi:hypothetical protein